MEEKKREIWFICKSCFRAFEKKELYKKHSIKFHKKINARQIVDNLNSPNFDQKYSNKDENEGFNSEMGKTDYTLRNRNGKRSSKGRGRGRPTMNLEEFQMKIRRPNLNINSRSLFHCSYCNYSSFKFAIIVHERIHRNERPFECKKCKSCFISNAELLKHFRSKYHINSNNSQPQKDKIWKSPTREFVAKIDDFIDFNKKNSGEGINSNPPETQEGSDSKMNSERRGRKMKKITFEEIVNYKCLECDYKTTYKNNLKIHQAVHLKDKPFSCFHCPYKTAFTSNLNYHLRAIHKKY